MSQFKRRLAGSRVGARKLQIQTHSFSFAQSKFWIRTCMFPSLPWEQQLGIGVMSPAKLAVSPLYKISRTHGWAVEIFDFCCPAGVTVWAQSSTRLRMCFNEGPYICINSLGRCEFIHEFPKCTELCREREFCPFFLFSGVEFDLDQGVSSFVKFGVARRVLYVHLPAAS